MIEVIRGVVVEGKQLGRTLGFPTANIIVEDSLPLKDGVYSSTVVVEGRRYAAISNVGSNPTVGGVSRRVESYIFDFGEDIYGVEIAIELNDFIREERKFASVEDLQAQIARDVERIKAGI